MTVRIRGDKELQAKLKNITDMRRFEPAMKAAGEDIQRWISPYPEINNEALAIAEGRRTWYERSFGTKWRRKDGSVGGRQTTEFMDKRWYIKTTASQFRARAIIGNNASYVLYVHSAAKQTRVHQRRNWRTDKQAIKARRDVIMNLFKATADKILEGK